MMKELKKTDAPLLLDSGFVDRVFNTSLFLGVILSLGSLSFGYFHLALSLGLGVAISLVFCRALWWTIIFLFPAGGRDKRQFFFLFSFLKYTTLAVFLYIIFRHLEVHPLAFLLGISVVQLVIFFTFMSMLLVNFLNKWIKVPSEGQA